METASSILRVCLHQADGVSNERGTNENVRSPISQPKEGVTKMKTIATEPTNQFSVVGVDPTRFFWTDGIGFWREDGKVFRDDVIVALNQRDAYWVAVSCGQICFLYVDFASKPNGFLLKAEEEELSTLFQNGKISGYTVLQRNPEGVPQCFTVVSPEEAEELNVDKTKLQPVYYEFVYV